VAAAASEIDQGAVAQARFYAQSYFSIFGRQVPPSYLDLGHLTTMLAQEGASNALYQTNAQLLATLDQAVIAERHGQGRPGSTGIPYLNLRHFPDRLWSLNPLSWNKGGI